ncbi:putative toxin-antitoxin system toxin component, PIN family [Bordetella genomosp. 8]|uniref:Putative toxin-antitoxin system toxin component, PIN family n=1 Tax=Bordetella genomosp. 8 TaxID=1416806 RepID=A0A1W6YLP3_9BORD|nr:putative toxin-antitoxin system toxin component, PIN family [Bordetella genomosp. 8]ARP81951.1 putative toxin-antitoxin system toxin component, PIN family [Bordetella genomosp. 8]
MKADHVVIDTNVLISAALAPASAPARFVDWALAHATLLFSPSTFEELQTRLWRPKFDRYLTLEQRQAILHDLGAVALCVTPASSARVFSRDPDDDKFIHLALAGNAAWIVTGDQDLLILEAVEGVQIVTPVQALNRLAGGS